MKTAILAVLAATALAGGALAQTTSSPAPPVPTDSSPGINPNASQPMDSHDATSAAPPNGYPIVTGRGRQDAPAGTFRPYAIPAHPDAGSGDDGGTAGKTIPD